jgi:hypothetical protein
MVSLEGMGLFNSWEGAAKEKDYGGDFAGLGC